MNMVTSVSCGGVSSFLFYRNNLLIFKEPIIVLIFRECERLKEFKLSQAVTIERRLGAWKLEGSVAVTIPFGSL